jgi:hypothetical protein
VFVVVQLELVQAVAEVKSVRGAVPVFRLDRFPEPLPAPGVPLSRHRALHKSRSVVRVDLHPVVSATGEN